MEKAAKTFVSALVVLLAVVLACPVAASDDFKIGIGGGATFLSGDYSKVYNTGWTGTVRAMWVPSWFILGIRGAGYYGQNSPSDSLGGAIKASTLYGADANAVLRLIGTGANGLYLNGGFGFRSLQTKVSLAGGEQSTTTSQVCYNGGAGFSTGWFFAEANVVYFSVSGTNFLSYPVTVGVQF